MPKAAGKREGRGRARSLTARPKRAQRPAIRVKRVYDEPAKGDGLRVLVDRIWPRGLRRDSARIDLWLRDIAPSNGLRRWFSHDPAKWTEFRRRYAAELDDRTAEIGMLAQKSRRRAVTLLFAARDTERNNAIALKSYLESLGWP